MRKLTTVHRVSEAEQIIDLLKSRGINAYIQERDTTTEVVVDMFNRAPSIEVWIVMDEQYGDALELLHNADHQVVHPLTEREIELLDEIESKAYAPATVSLIRFAMMLFAGVVLICVVAYWLRA